MILTRRFGTLRARQTFPSVSVTDVEDLEHRAAEVQDHKPEPKVHHILRRHRTDHRHAA